MAGLSPDGFSIKRLAEVISDRQASARNYFGNDAAVGVNDVLGRALRIHSPAEADLWELAEAVYNSFNPVVATGNQLDVIVSYAGLTRFGAEPSTVSLLVTGDVNTVIPEESTVTSSFTSESFETDSSVTLNTTGTSGVTVEVISVNVGSVYSVTLGGERFSYTAQTGDTVQIISSQLAAVISDSASYTATSPDTTVIIAFDDVFVPKNVSVSARIVTRKISKVIQASATSAGEIYQEENTLDTIATPISGWDSVTNPEAASGGRDVETDEELRVRFANAKEANARGTIDAIYSNLLLISGVTSVQVFENTSDATDANGIPSHSISTVILGGNSQTIADALWDIKPAGINTYGNTTVTVTDSQGLPHDISFNRPVEVPVYISATISQAENESMPSTAADQVVDALISYFEANLGVGDDVIYSRLYIPVQSVEGVQIDSMTIGESPSPVAMSNVVIDFDQIASLDASNIEITVH